MNFKRERAVSHSFLAAEEIWKNDHTVVKKLDLLNGALVVNGPVIGLSLWSQPLVSVTNLSH